MNALKTVRADKTAPATGHPTYKEEPLSGAMAETLRLYHAWLGYLLTRLGADEVRVPTEDIRRALTRLSCRVEKDGTDYVIHLEKGATGGEHHDG